MKFILFILLLVSVILTANANNSYSTDDVSKFIDYMAKKHGYKKALTNDPNFLAGLNVHKGSVTYKAVADTFGHKFLSPKEAIL